MQPYFFPYLGYFQLIHAVDTFVIYDDVNYIKGGWVNRNYILCQQEKRRITLALEGASPNKLINQISVGGNRVKLLKTLNQCYVRAPYFRRVFPLFEEILSHTENHLARFLYLALRQVSTYLGLQCTWHISSNLTKDNKLRGQEKVLAICEELGANQYINLPGGKALYDNKSFARRGVRLSFIEPKPVSYRQSSDDFVANLSIIDIMMFNDSLRCDRLLEEYEVA